MTVLKEIEGVREQVRAWREQGFTVGLVPTMGYLHEGHASLIRRAAEENDRVVVSVFVNPTQFGPKEDLSSYPRDLVRDIETVERSGGDMIFYPEASAMYPEAYSTYVEVGGITGELCGRSRPAHFRGVATVVTKLFNIVRPDRAYFGRKDAQQLAVIRRMAKDLNMDLEIVGCPIVREPDGLAMSSRNSYLSKEERADALVLSRALRQCRERFQSGCRDAQALKEEMRGIIAGASSAVPDYVEIVDAVTFHSVKTIEKKALAALAVYIGKTRLIDNTLLDPDDEEDPEL
ncbi:pantoate--beta-alanine ligase [Papillibacter cinnamivorans]|nr:pantoate--beta-alanine ligase [Papillibacter cinnamivorans]